MTPGKKRIKGVQSSKGGNIDKKDREMMSMTRGGGTEMKKTSSGVKNQ